MSNTEENEKPSIVVRFAEDTKTRKCWFEEKLKDGQFVKIPSTMASCEGNSRHALAQLIEDRRQERLRVLMSYGKEERHNLG